ncbi:MFS transporter [Fluviispira vulneris]|uniref:MFS transporter n=1 Tax=Fluviispira vulneris TaxID=2763012 RepID=UPI00164489DB|nr:MFS transporter [Fluviispira vulneris]
MFSQKILASLGRDFYLMQTSAILNGIGARCGQFAVAWWILDKTGSETTFAFFVSIGVLVEVIAKALFGWLGDSFSRQKIISYCYVLSSVASIVLTFLSLKGIYNPFIISACLVGLGLAIGIRVPLQSSITPLLVPAERLNDAIQVRSFVLSSSSFLGPIIAGILLGPLGYANLLILNTFAVILSLILVIMIKTQESSPDKLLQGQNFLLNWFYKTRAGYNAVFQIKSEFYLAIIALTINFSLFPFFFILLPSLIFTGYPKSTWLIAILEGSFSIGLIFGSLGIVNNINKIMGRFKSIFLGILLIALSIVSTGLSAKLFVQSEYGFAILVAPWLFAGGIGLSLLEINSSLVRSLATPDSYRNRVMSTVAFMSGLMMPFGTLIGGFFSKNIGINFSMISLGALIGICAFFVLLNKELLKVFSLKESEMPDAYLRLYPKAFL